MSDQIQGARGVLVKVGLGNPTARGFVAGAAVGVLAYSFRMPDCCFDEEGQVRPFKALSASPHATYAHFLLVPVVAAGAVALLT